MLAHKLFVTEQLIWVLCLRKVHREKPCAGSEDLFLILADVSDELLRHFELLFRICDVPFHEDRQLPEQL